MANRSEGLLRRDRARDDALAAFGILEFVQLAPNLVEDRLGLFPGLDVSVRLAPLQVEADSAQRLFGRSTARVCGDSSGRGSEPAFSW